MAVKLHRYGLPLLLSVWMLLACGCCRMEKTDITEEQLYHGSEISFTTEFSTYPMGTEKFNWTLENQGNFTLGFGDATDLEMQREDGWHRIASQKEIKDYLGILEIGQHSQGYDNASSFVCLLTPGRYRLIKWITFKGAPENCCIVAEFDIV